MKILIVDDDPDTLEALNVALISFGYKVVTAKNGLQAARIIKSSIENGERIELLITDLKMPGMDGLELIRSAKELKPGLPAILITAYGDDSVQRDIRRLDGCGYIEKPFGPDRLMEMITEIGN